MSQLVRDLFVFICCSITVLEAALECRSYKKKGNLDIQQLDGVWWEYQSFDSYDFVEPHDCLVAQMTSTKSSLTIKENFISIKDGRDDAKQKTREYKLEATHKNNIESFYGTLTSGGKTKAYVSYRVLNTDYKNWLIVYICGANNIFTGGMVLTRSQKLEASMKETIQKRLMNALGQSSQQTDTSISNQYTIIDNERCKLIDNAGNLLREIKVE